MRIGIVTIHHVQNYGAVLQAYALSKTLSRMGHDVEVVDYRPDSAETHYGGRWRLRGALRRAKFARFVSTCLPLSRRRYRNLDELRDAGSHYDTLVAGSDQIWNTTSFRGYDPAFFLAFRTAPAILGPPGVRGVRKLSYAASAGDTADFGEHTAAIRDALADFAAISVRDDATARLIHATTGQSPVTVLDPVFLHDFAELLPPPPETSPSAEAPARRPLRGANATGDIVVFSTRPERFRAVAEQLSRELAAPITALLHPMPGAHRCVAAPSPAAWLRRIHGARVVLTDYFHGLALALRFARPVLADVAPGKATKITDLLRRAGVSDHLLPQAVERGAWGVGRDSSNAADPSTPHAQHPTPRAATIPDSLRSALADPAAYAGHIRAHLAADTAASRSFLEQHLQPAATPRPRAAATLAAAPPSAIPLTP